jgi:hypothetical protein
MALLSWVRLGGGIGSSPMTADLPLTTSARSKVDELQPLATCNITKADIHQNIIY